MKKLYFVLLPLHMLLMALIPAVLIACRVMDYTLILTRPMPVFIALAVPSVALSIAIFFASLGRRGNFFTGLLGHLDFLMAACSALYLMTACGNGPAVAIAAVMLLTGLAVPIASSGDSFPKVLEWIFAILPFTLCFIVGIVLCFMSGGDLPWRIQRDLPSVNGTYTAVTSCTLDRNDAYNLSTVRVTRTDAIRETEFFRLFPNVMVIHEPDWQKESVRDAEWISGNALLINGIEYPMSGNRLLPVSTNGL